MNKEKLHNNIVASKSESFLRIDSKMRKEKYSLQFDLIAKKILNESLLITPTDEYIIREIEFYYFSENHTDYYCHRNERQKTNSKLYFHRFKNPDKYIHLKQKGIDLTIGNGLDTYGGTLIRAIQNNLSNEIITGIGKITNKIITDIKGADKIIDIYENDQSIFDQSSIIHLTKTENNKLDIFKKPRIGINLKKDDTDRFFHQVNYNYFTYPQIKKLT